MRIAIVTPYHKEPEVIVRRAVESVLKQTRQCQHYLVSDGHPQSWIDDAGPRTHHLRLSVEHRDYGNTPRCLGALLAMSEGAEAIGFLDADNALDEDHIALCIAAARSGPGVDYIVAQRRLALPDGTPVPIAEERGHVDTNCYFLLPGAFQTIPNWILQPRPLTIICDRIYLMHLQVQRMTSRKVSRPTVTYYGHWARFYEAAGRVPPPDAKKTIDGKDVIRWWQRLSKGEQDLIRRRLAIPGLDFGQRP